LVQIDFLLGFIPFSAALATSFREGNFHNLDKQYMNLNFSGIFGGHFPDLQITTIIWVNNPTPNRREE